MKMRFKQIQDNTVVKKFPQRGAFPFLSSSGKLLPVLWVMCNGFSRDHSDSESPPPREHSRRTGLCWGVDRDWQTDSWKALKPSLKHEQWERNVPLCLYPEGRMQNTCVLSNLRAVCVCVCVCVWRIEILCRDMKRRVWFTPPFVSSMAFSFLIRAHCQHTHLLSICIAGDFNFLVFFHKQSQDLQSFKKKRKRQSPPAIQRRSQDSCLTRRLGNLPFIFPHQMRFRCRSATGAEEHPEDLLLNPRPSSCRGERDWIVSLLWFVIAQSSSAHPGFL